MTEGQISKIVFRSALLILLIALIAWFAWTVRGVLVLMLVAVVLATGISPIVNSLAGISPRRERYRLPRGLAVLIIYLFLFILIGVFSIALVPPLVQQAETFVASAPRYLDQAQVWLKDLGNQNPMLVGIDERLVGGIQSSIGGFSSLLSQSSQVLRFAIGVLSGALNFLLLLVLTLYLVLDGKWMHNSIVKILPENNRELALRVSERAAERIGGWLVGQVMLSLIIGVTTYIGLIILGMPYALLLAVIAAVGEVIPMVGPIISAVPAIAIALFISPVQALLALALYILIQQLENNLIVPQVMRRAINLPPVIVMVALMMGSEMLGVVGAILSLPVTAAISVLISELIAIRDTGEVTSSSAPQTSFRIRGQRRIERPDAE